MKSVAVVAESGRFPEANAVALAQAAKEAGLAVTATEVLPAGFTDFTGLLQRLKAGAPDVQLTSLGGSTAGFFKAYEASGWTVPVSGRMDFGAAVGAVSPGFRAAGGLSGLSGIAVFSTLVDRPGVRDFVAAYQAHYGLVPTQRSFFVYEATYLVVDAIRRAGADEPAAVQAALKTTTMASRLGGSYAPDEHNHAHTPLFVLGLREGKVGVVATE